MKLQVILAGAAAVALVAGAAQAATQKNAGTYAEPSQPIAYSKLDTYLKSSGHSRKTKDWALDTQAASAAAPNAAANASANAPQGASGPAGDMTQPSTGTAPADQGAAAPAPPATAPNPPATAPQPAPDSSAQPPATGAAPDSSAQPPATSAPQ
jgi:hypothetical protein